MGWKLLDKPKTQRVTKKLAKEFAEMDPAPHDRPLSERRLQVYQRLLKENQFRPVTWASALCTETGGVYRVNGKHTSVMLSGLDALPEFFVTVEEYECDTLEDVAKLYATFDSKMMSRTARDIYLSFAATVPELAALSAKVVGLCVSGMAYHLLGENSARHAQPAERAELLLEHPEFVLWADQTVGEGGYHRSETTNAGGTRQSARHLQRAPVVAAMMGTWQKSKAKATEFWAAVRDETGASPELPDRKLARYLLTTGLDAGTGTRRVKTSNGREMYVRCIHGWNAWRTGESTNLRYHADAKVPSIK